MYHLFKYAAVFCLISNSIQSSGSTETTTTTETFNEHGVCESALHPHASSDCFGQTNKSYSCCFVHLESEEHHLNETLCMPIEYEYKFAAPFIHRMDYHEYTNISTSITCNLAKGKTCGMYNPPHLFDCREHDSNSYSCCMIHTGDSTNCILGGTKFGHEVNFTAWGNLVECNETFFSRMTILKIASLLLLLLVDL